MQVAPGMEDHWAERVRINSDDPYSKGVIDYAIRWADLMEAGIERGAKLEDIADRASHDADTEGITGFMYGAAVAELSQAWVHGDELRRWHNKKYGVDEDKAQGGTVNPAIITIGGQ